MTQLLSCITFSAGRHIGAFYLKVNGGAIGKNVLSHVQQYSPGTPGTVACQAPLSMGFSRQAY